MQRRKNKNDVKVFPFAHSWKCVPVASKKQIMVKMFHFTNAFIQKIRWRVYHYDKALQLTSNVNGNNVTSNTNDINDDNTQSHKRIFPTPYSAPPCNRILAFESDLIDLVKNIEFRYVNNTFQNELRKDIRRINSSNNIIVFSDKTNNLYEIKPEAYNDLLRDNITRDYKLCDSNIVDNINDEAWNIIKDNRIQGKIPKLDRSNAYITIKDHKDNFPSQIKCRLINPSKTHIGKISKSIIDKIITDVRSKSNLMQWNNSNDVLLWFDKVQNKSNKCFINFDIVDFYPSITKEHLVNALNFARDLSDFSDTDTSIILHACKTILFSTDRTWQKKDASNSELFDVPMGSFHGAEICDLVGLFILNKFKNILDNCGMYRDDGLAIIDITSPQNYVRLKKKIIKLMKDIGFKITINIGQIRTNFLDVSLDLYHNNYKPYRKPNSHLNYINYNSNHPQHIKKQLPKMIEKRLNSLSKNESVFNSIKTEYNEALTKSGFKYRLNYTDNRLTKPPSTSNKRKRTRKIIFFNPPFCESVKTNIGREFLKLVDKHFPNSHCYHNLFNRKTLKISYSCMHNIRSIIQAHNRRILNGLASEVASTSGKTHTQQNINMNMINNTSTPVKRTQATAITKLASTSGKTHTQQNINMNMINNTSTPVKRTQATAITKRYNLRNTPSRIARNSKPLDTPTSDNGTNINDNSINNIISNSNNNGSGNNNNNNPLLNVNTNNSTPVVAPITAASTSSTGTRLVSGNTTNTASNGKTCNCKKSNVCPLDGKCMVNNVVYNVVARFNDVEKTYIGSTGTTFKQRLYQHNSTFRLPKYRYNTELSKYMWSCFDRFGSRPDLKWSILHNIGRPPTSASKICSLCNLERWEIASAEDRRNLLNRRSEISGGCPHRRNLYFPNLPPLSS